MTECNDTKTPPGLSTVNLPVPRIRSLSFLTPGNYPDDDPYSGLEETLQLFEFGEQQGFDGAWIRQRHLEHGVSSAAVFLAAATQRTHRIQLGTAVIPIGYESPFRLGEDLTTADVLSCRRLQVGLSTGMPHAELMTHLVYDGDWRSYDLSYGRIARLVENLRGHYLGISAARARSSTHRETLNAHGCNRTALGWSTGSGTAGQAGGRCAGPLNTA